MITRFLAAISVILLFVHGNNAQAKNISSYDPQSIVATLTQFGLEVDQGVDEDDNSPILVTTIEETDIRLAFTNCDKGKACKFIQALSYIDCENRKSACLSAAEMWRKGERFANLYVPDDNEYLGLYYFISTTTEGISEASLLSILANLRRDTVNLSLEVEGSAH